MSVGLMQRVPASYRVPFFDLLSDMVEGGLSLYAGDARPEEMIDSSRLPQRAALWKARNIHLFRGKAYLCIQTDVIRWLEESDPEVLIQEANLRYPMSRSAAAWMHRRGRPVIGWGLGTGKTGRAFPGLLRQYDAMLTYSGPGKESYIRAGFPENRVFVAKNAAVRRPNLPMPSRPDTFAGDPVVLYVGRLQERKRPDLLIRACAESAFHPELVIVGDGPIRADLQKLAAEVYPGTIFRGARYGEELTREFERADLFVMPGTGGLALQQAMASALPVIAAEADGTQQDLVRQQNGVLIRGGDMDELRTAVDSLLGDPARMRKMGEESFNIVYREINLDTMAETFLQAIGAVTRHQA